MYDKIDLLGNFIQNNFCIIISESQQKFNETSNNFQEIKQQMLIKMDVIHPHLNHIEKNSIKALPGPQAIQDQITSRTNLYQTKMQEIVQLLYNNHHHDEEILAKNEEAKESLLTCQKINEVILQSINENNSLIKENQIIMEDGIRLIKEQEEQNGIYLENFTTIIHDKTINGETVRLQLNTNHNETMENFTNLENTIINKTETIQKDIEQLNYNMNSHNNDALNKIQILQNKAIEKELESKSGHEQMRSKLIMIQETQGKSSTIYSRIVHPTYKKAY
ncbi:MAG: hypothetical protein Ta2E_10750 [Mycoplasmoidaceae bacterium]|nr:MAG: hypothetical protein Ta2E_10750 [Mycoplasmoidaceae bacterium]